VSVASEPLVTDRTGRTSVSGAGTALYRSGPAAPERTLWEVLEATASRFPRAAAVDDGRSVLEYADLLRRALRLGADLAAAGVGAGDRVGVRVSSGTSQLYVSILAVLSTGAAYVPVDVDDPAERADLVWSGAGVCAVLGDGGTLVPRPGRTPGGRSRRPSPDDDAWVIFTSGTTGTPKGVAVTHRSAAAFVDAEARLFLRDEPVGPGDRVLASLSVAFDASCEEMWLAWRHGACLVPAPRAIVRTGADLVDWMTQRQISVVSTVPTLASLWPVDLLGGVRLLVLGGEPCPAALADRLAARCQEVWNTYGPTEATVVSCATPLVPGEPVRIGLPLDGWQLAVVSPQTGQPLPWGEVGELVIGGVGLARYLDADQDARRFGPLPALGWDRAYRSGDLVRGEPDGLVYVGRADAQVKIRGYRIELGEIESVLLQIPGVVQAAVTTYEPQPGLVELAAFYAVGAHGPAPDPAAVVDRLRGRFPAHMVPAYVEPILAVPVLPNGKIDRDGLPRPTAPRYQVDDGSYVPPATPTEHLLATALADVLGVERVSADSSFFDDLGVHSLTVAHFCARARELGGPDAPALATQDVYLHPTVRRLARVMDAGHVAAPVTAPDAAPDARPRASSLRLAVVSVVQALFLLGSLCLGLGVVVLGATWVVAADGPAAGYLRAVAFGGAVLVGWSVLPVIAKWVLIGRWTARRFPIWSGTYLRFWAVRTMTRVSPMAALTGSPLYSMYLRALGAKVGRRALVLASGVPVCTDLLSIGDDVVIRRASSFNGYRARAGTIETGPVQIGAGAFVGDHTVLDIGTSIGAGAQLGHTSTLHEGQSVPAGQHWHGSPAQPTDVEYRRTEPLPVGRWRAVLHGTGQVVVPVFVAVPLALGVVDVVVARPELAAVVEGGAARLGTLGPYLAAVLLSLAAYLGSILLGLVVVVVGPRAVHRLVEPGRVYPLYGLHDTVQRWVRRLTNVKFYLELFGDSSYVTGYLRALGYRMPDLEQTGSNFGADQGQDTPFGVVIGRGTMVADGSALINAEYSSTSFKVLPLTLGARNFLGTAVAYPAGARIGDDCLIATKAMVPLDGPVRSGVGLLGSPSFEIPRSVTIDTRFDDLRTGPEFRRRLAAKNRHNLATIAIFLLVRWVHTAVLTAIGLVAAVLYVGLPHLAGVLVLAGAVIVGSVFGLPYFVLVERLTIGFGALRARYCSIYDPYFWWHERYWKLMAPYLDVFNGTPFKSVAWRLVGVQVGRRLFDDGCGIAEHTMVTIGDDCTLNSGSVAQCHSMEDGTFKSDRTVLGDGCTVGVQALVHYGVTVGPGAEILPDAFVMKGETVPAGARWGGNPARPM
jgi:non-ribosomal peptide synthetase-like protein